MIDTRKGRTVRQINTAVKLQIKTSHVIYNSYVTSPITSELRLSKTEKLDFKSVIYWFLST